jgi:hypothetical protein
MASLALQRSKQYLEEKGFHVWITEHWNQWSRTRQDLFGFADLVAVRHDSKGVWAVNACGEDVASHTKKYLNGWEHPKKGHQPPNPHLPVWLAAGNRLSIMGWRLRKNEGTRDTYQLRMVEFYLEGAEVKWKELPSS